MSELSERYSLTQGTVKNIVLNGNGTKSSYIDFLMKKLLRSLQQAIKHFFYFKIELKPGTKF